MDGLGTEEEQPTQPVSLDQTEEALGEKPLQLGRSALGDVKKVVVRQDADELLHGSETRQLLRRADATQHNTNQIHMGEPTEISRMKGSVQGEQTRNGHGLNHTC